MNRGCRSASLRCFRLHDLLSSLSGTAAAAGNLYIKNDAVCLPTLSFKDRVVAVALSQARAFGFDTVSCSSTGNLANAVAAHAAREGLKAWIFIPSDLEPAKILGTNVFGAKVVRIAGNYDQVNRLCSQIADEHRWGFVNVNLRPYYAEGSKTVGFEIAEQLGWRLPDNIVCPMAGGSLITKIKKAFDELIKLGLVEAKGSEVLRRASDRMLSDFDRGQDWQLRDRAAEAQHDRALARDRQSRRRPLRDQDHQGQRRMERGRQRSGSDRLDPTAGGNRRHLHRDRRRRDRRNAPANSIARTASCPKRRPCSASPATA